MATSREIEMPDSLSRTAKSLETINESELLGEKLTINMGPSHPATHGVLRIVLELDGEIITKATPDIGYLHRGDEKIAENMQYNQFVPYTDRLDYLAPLSNNVAYALAVEKLLSPGRGGRIAELPGGGTVETRKGRLNFKKPPESSKMPTKAE